MKCNNYRTDPFTFIVAPPPVSMQTGGSSNGGQFSGSGVDNPFDASNSTDSSIINSGSSLGNFFRGIPVFGALFGGLLGGAGDIISGVGNAALGLATFGLSGTFSTGLREIVGGFGAELNISSKDVQAGLAGIAGKVYVTMRDVLNFATLGQVDAFGRQKEGVTQPNEGVFQAIYRMLIDAPVPMYGNFNGPAWGVPNFGLQKSLIINHPDATAYRHDQFPYDDWQWVRDQYTTPSKYEWGGPIGAGYVLFGTFPFIVIGLGQRLTGRVSW